jgi:hypothetical protein
LAQTAQTAVAEADLEAWAENLSETLQYVWQLQKGCAYACYGVYQFQSSEQGQSTSQSAKATARDEDDGTMLALGPDGVIVLPGWLVALANNVGATIQTIYQYQEASCLERCDGGAQVQEAVQRAIVEQVATAIVLTGQPAPPSEPPPGGTAPPAPQAPGPATPAPAQPAAATRAPADGAPVNLRQARLVAEALPDLQKGNLAARPDGRSLVAGPPASLSGGLPPAEVASSAPHGEPADRNVAGGRGSRPAHGSDAGPGSFLGVEFHPAPETLGEDDGRDWTSLILLALFAGLALVAVGPRAPRAG